MTYSAYEHTDGKWYVKRGGKFFPSTESETRAEAASKVAAFNARHYAELAEEQFRKAAVAGADKDTLQDAAHAALAVTHTYEGWLEDNDPEFDCMDPGAWRA